MVDGRPIDILIGPRTTVFTLLAAYPFLESWLLDHASGFEAITGPRGRASWARVTTLSDVALSVDRTWRQVVREIAAEIERVTGRLPRTATAVRPVANDDSRLAALRQIDDDLEAGASLLDLADRRREVTRGLEPTEIAGLEEALESAVRSAAGLHLGTPPDASGAAVLPEGHPLDTIRREAAQIIRLCEALRAASGRLGGSPSRRGWQRERAKVARLVDRLVGVELRFRRELQAWFPALGVHGVDGPRALLVERQADALETLRRLRLSVARDDATSAVEHAARLVAQLGELLAQDEHVLIPLAARHLSAGDWAVVRELEDGVGWSLIPTPPPWPVS